MNWKNDRPDGFDTETIYDSVEGKEVASARDLIEAGASALLELLRKNGARTDMFRNNHEPISISNPGQKGCYVFIPKK